MSNAKDLIKAVACITTAYSEDLREIEDLKKRLRRAERKIRDLYVEIQHYAEMAHNYESRMDTRPPGYFDYIPSSTSYSPESPPDYWTPLPKLVKELKLKQLF